MSRYPKDMTTGTFPLMLLAAFKHPQPAGREKIRGFLSEWVDSLEPKYSAQKIETVLKNNHGTALEPFRLNEDEQWAAILLTRIAFSKKKNQTRVVINSSFNPEQRGGLVLTNNLKHFFVNRLNEDSKTSLPKSAWQFNPGRLQLLPKLPGFLDSSSKLGQAGYELQIRPSPLLTSDWYQIDWDSKLPKRYNDLGMLSYVEGGKSLIQEGVDIWIEQGVVRLQLNKPETIIRWGAKLSSSGGLPLCLRIADQNKNRKKQVRIQVPLRTQSIEKSMQDARLLLVNTDLSGWCCTGDLNGPDLKKTERTFVEEVVTLPQ